MKRYIKTDTETRVRIIYDSDYEDFTIRLQKKFWLFWLNTDFGVCVKESDEECKGEETRPIVLSTKGGWNLEVYKKGGIYFERIANRLAKQYVSKEERDEYNKKMLK